MTQAGQVSVDALAVVARQRAVLTEVADAVTAAAAGRGLRVAVVYAPDQAAFVELLTQALFARGRPCRSLPLTGCPSAAGRADGPLVAVLTSPAALTGSVGEPEDTDVCRVDIELRGANGPLLSGARGSGCDWRPGIVVDFADPAGPRVSRSSLV